MKYQLCIALISLLYSSLSIKITSQYSNQLPISSETYNTEGKEHPSLLESVVTSHNTGIDLRLNNNEVQTFKDQSDSHRFKSTETRTETNLRPMESPEIVKSFGPDFKVETRIGELGTQSITNYQSFNALYDSHEDYYRNKNVRIIDPNYETMNKYFLNDFKKTLDKYLVYNKSAESVDDLNIPYNAFPVQGASLPKITPESVEAQIRAPPRNSKLTETDPFNAYYPA